MYLSVITDELKIEAKEALPIIKSWGCEYVDFKSLINGKSIESQTDEELKDLKALVKSYGLKIGVLLSSIGKAHLPEKDRLQKDQEKLEGLIRAAKILDCNNVRIWFYWTPRDGAPDLLGKLPSRPDMMKAVLEMFDPFMKRIKEAGLMPGFENCACTADEVIAFLDAVNVPGWGMAWDVYHYLHLIPQDQWAEFFIRCTNKSVAVHTQCKSIIKDLCNSPENNKDEFIAPWDRILRGIAASGKNIPISVETHCPRDSKYTPIETSKRCYDLLKANWPTAIPANIEEAVK